MKQDWKKDEKALYLPPAKPVRLAVPAMDYFQLEGRGDPNGEEFGEAVGVLYSLSYAVKMLPKKCLVPPGYFEYTVYPLEALWRGEARDPETGALDKTQLRYTVMIRQPEFVDRAVAALALGQVADRKPHPLLVQVRFGTVEDGDCVQMLHVGSYDSEPASFAAMEAFCGEQGLVRRGESHREIYLRDPRRTAPDKLRTLLRFGVEERTG